MKDGSCEGGRKEGSCEEGRIKEKTHKRCRELEGVKSNGDGLHKGDNL